MGVIQSIFCTMTFCVERILTWICCGFLLMLLMFIILMLMVYGISVGYHYAQKELTDFAFYARADPSQEYAMRTAQLPDMRATDSRRYEENDQSYEPRPVTEVYQTRKPYSEPVFTQPPETPIVLLATDRTYNQNDAASHEHQLARKLIGRVRRSHKNVLAPPSPFSKVQKQSNSTRLAGTSSRGRIMAFT